MSLKGIKEVTKNLESALSKIKGMTAKGFIEVSIILRTDMENTPPKIPVDTGALRASYFTIVTEGKGTITHREGEDVAEVSSVMMGLKDPACAIGFTADHAVRVHEDMQTKFKRPGSGAKFLEAAIKRNRSKILSTLAKNIRL